jgi:CheY-like chemotaxis protein
MSQTILIAITDPNIVYLLQRYAEESGFQTVRSVQEEELLQLARQVQPALIVLQVEPPEADRQQVLQCLKSDPVIGHIPVVAYSCFDQNSPIAGIAGFLQKSVLYSDFLLMLEQTGVPVDRPSVEHLHSDCKGICNDS